MVVSWEEDWEDEAEDTEEELDYLLSEDEPESTDEEIWDRDIGARLEHEWEPKEDDEDTEFSAVDDPVLGCQRIVTENPYDRRAPISEATLLEQTDEVSVERMEQRARTEADFKRVCSEWDRLDKNRRRRERYYEILKDEIYPEGIELYGGKIFPCELNTPIHKLILRGNFLDLFYSCPYEMHQLIGDPFLSQMVKNLSEEQKEVLYFLSLQLFSTTALAQVRNQSDRNIRKIRDTYTRKLQKQLYGHLLQKKAAGEILSNRELEFLSLYEAALKEKGSSAARVKRENKYPTRKKATHAENRMGVQMGDTL